MTDPRQMPTDTEDLQALDEIDKSNPFSAKGRFTRLSYLAWTFVFTLTAFLTAFIVAAGFGVDNPESVDSTAMNAIAFIFMAALAIPGIIFGIRRLHDVDNPGYWIILIIIPVVSLGLWLYLSIKKGSVGGNSFGPYRPTLNWERTAGYLMIALIVFSIAGGIIFMLTVA